MVQYLLITETVSYTLPSSFLSHSYLRWKRDTFLVFSVDTFCLCIGCTALKYISLSLPQLVVSYNMREYLGCIHKSSQWVSYVSNIGVYIGQGNDE